MIRYFLQISNSICYQVFPYYWLHVSAIIQENTIMHIMVAIRFRIQRICRYHLVVLAYHLKEAVLV